MVQPSRAPTVTGEWECTDCGFVVEGVKTRRPPRCPECGAAAAALEFLEAEEDDWEELDEDLDEDGMEFDDDDGGF